MGNRAKPKSTRWRINWVVETVDGKRSVPAFEFLRKQPEGPRIQLLQIVEAVCSVGGPDHWKDATSHDRMEGTLDDLHEARDRHGETLYRLYLRWQRVEGVVWIIDGRTKPNNTKLPTKEYDKIRALADTIDTDPPPAAEAHDFATQVLQESD